jgi:citronellol/citronellal dehydrogenase
MLCKPAKEFTGQFCIDETLLAEHGVTDFSHYAVEPGKRLMADLFVDDEELLHTRPAE